MVMTCGEKSTVTDKLGDKVEFGYGTLEDRQAIIDMYDRISPKAITQGLPPIEEEARAAWIDKLIENGENFLAWKDGEVIGHSSLITDKNKSDGEYIIFVNQTRRNRGLGTELTLLTVSKARELGIKSIWLTVEALNFRAIKLYKKVGFVFCDAGDRERTMLLRL
jgi:RimJ/RimL family protein N-acetyltransferase